MRRILMLSLLVAAACGGPSRGELEVDWTFEGATCFQAGVATIQVDVANEVLSPNQFTCEQASLGANLGVYYVGDYQVTVTGLDLGGHTAYQSTQTLRVDSGKTNTYAVDVTRVASGSASLTWAFDGKNCTDAIVTKVQIFVDPDSGGNGGVDAGTVPCSTMGTNGASVENIAPGTHTFAILAFRTLTDGDHLVYRTHNPPAAFIVVNVITDVFVSAESPP